MALALVLISFTLFKGVTNLVNAVIVPLALFIAFQIMTGKERLSFALLVVLVVILYIPVQIIFVLYYLFIAWKMCGFVKQRIRLFVQLTLLNALAVPIGVRLTDQLFMTVMEKVLLGLVGNQLIFYGLWMLIQGAFLGLIQLKGWQLLIKRKVF